MDAAEVDWAETFPQRNCRVRAVGSSCPMAAPGASIKSQPSHILFPPMPCLQDPWFFCFPRFPQAHDSHNNHPRGGRSKKICYAPESFSFNFANRITNNGRQILWHAFAFRIRLELMLEPKRPLEQTRLSRRPTFARSASRPFLRPSQLIPVLPKSPQTVVCSWPPEMAATAATGIRSWGPI